MSISIKDIKSVFERPKVKPSTSATSGQSQPGGIAFDERFLSNGTNTYTIKSENWYTAKPYGFKATLRTGATVVMFLPINPSNLTITTNFATNIISTLYGTVEEHSDVRYFDITIAGTTGIAPRFVAPSIVDGGDMDPGAAYESLRKSGRSAFAPVDSFSAGGFFSKTLAIANQIKNKANDLVNGSAKPKNGLNADNSGYVAFHNLYRFLLQYKKDAAGVINSNNRKKHPLTFFNYKDGNRYDVAVRSFTMVRSADNPMLYNYTIQLRGYNLQSLTDKVDENIQRRLQDLGLAGIDGSSILGDIKSISSKAKGIIGSAVGGINSLGR